MLHCVFIVWFIGCINEKKNDTVCMLLMFYVFNYKLETSTIINISKRLLSCFKQSNCLLKNIHSMFESIKLHVKNEQIILG